MLISTSQYGQSKCQRKLMYVYCTAPTSMGKGSLPKKREYIKTFDLKEGGGQFENLFFK